MVGLLKEMISKFEEDPPLSTKTTAEHKDPHELLTMVSNLQLDGWCAALQLMINNQIIVCCCCCLLTSCLFQAEADKIDQLAKSQLLGEEI